MEPVHFSHSVRSKSLGPHGLLHSRLPYTSPTPGTCSNSCPLSHWCHPSNHLICCPLLLRPSVFPSIRVFSNESALWIRWPKFWSFSFNINPSDCSRRDSQKVFSNTRVLSINSSVLSVFIVQLSHPYMNAGKTIALTRQTFVDKVMSLLFNMLSRLDITFLPRSKCLLISWLQSPSAVIWSPPK